MDGSLTSPFPPIQVLLIFLSSSLDMCCWLNAIVSHVLQDSYSSISVFFPVIQEMSSVSGYSAMLAYGLVGQMF